MAEMLNDERLAGIEARANAATSGPWHIRASGVDTWYIYGNSVDARICHLDGAAPLANSEFLAAARDDVPDLIDTLRRVFAAFRRYGRHDPDCPEAPCACGFEREWYSYPNEWYERADRDAYRDQEPPPSSR